MLIIVFDYLNFTNTKIRLKGKKKETKMDLAKNIIEHKYRKIEINTVRQLFLKLNLITEQEIILENMNINVFLFEL